MQRRTFSSIGKFHVRGFLSGFEGFEHLDAVGADAPCEGDAEADAEEGADRRVGLELAGGGCEGLAVRRFEA
jgi:hypothetical protein